IEIHNLSDEFLRWLWIAQPSHIKRQGSLPLHERLQQIRLSVGDIQSSVPNILDIGDVVLPDVTAHRDRVRDRAPKETHMPLADPLRDLISLPDFPPRYPLAPAIKVNQLLIHVQERSVDGNFQRILTQFQDRRLSLGRSRNGVLDV